MEKISKNKKYENKIFVGPHFKLIVDDKLDNCSDWNKLTKFFNLSKAFSKEEGCI